MNLCLRLDRPCIYLHVGQMEFAFRLMIHVPGELSTMAGDGGMLS